MKSLATIFIFTMSIFTIEQAEAFQAISQNMQQEYEIAIEISKKFQKGALTKEQANELLISLFSDYSHADGKLATIAQFIQKTIGIGNPIIKGSSEQRGWSGSEVYSIQTEATQEPPFFLKIFPYDSKHYLPEIFGLSFMREITEVDSPKVYVCGQCLINENRYFLILESPVKGLSIQQYYNRVGQHSIDSKERRQAFAELCEAVQACGIGLARFHNQLPSKKQPLPKDAENRMIQDLNSAIEELIYQPMEGIEIERLQACTEHVIQKMKIEDHLIGLTYDDIKTVHTFYDLASKTFSFVNPDRLYLSFDQEGEVQGLLIKDVCKYLLSLTLNRFQYFFNENQTVVRRELLTEQEVNIMRNLFELSYVQGGGVLPNPIEKDYVFLQHDLFFIKNSRRNLPEPELTRVKDLINLSLENLKSRLRD
jgi:hypothetical protein